MRLFYSFCSVNISSLVSVPRRTCRVTRTSLQSYVGELPSPLDYKLPECKVYSPQCQQQLASWHSTNDPEWLKGGVDGWVTSTRLKMHFYDELGAVMKRSEILCGYCHCTVLI